MAGTHYIYGLKGLDGEIRYVGLTKNPNERLGGHLRGSGGPVAKTWIKNQKARGYEPEMVILQEAQDAHEAKRAEADWIAILTEHEGKNLLNVIRPLDRVSPWGRLRQIRARKHMTLKELGSKSGVSYPQISRIENGYTEKPHFSTMQKLADALGVTVSELEGVSA